MSRQDSPCRTNDPKQPCYRLTVLGGSAVGKTALLKRFFNDEFIEKHRETVEDLFIRSFHVNGRSIQAACVDTAGNNEFPAMRRLSIGNAQAFLLVYDVSSKSSFRMLEGIIREIKDVRPESEMRDLPIVIAANKCDLELDQCIISPQMINEFMLNETLDCRAVHMETSAKTGHNVRSIFETFIKISPLFLDQTVDRSPAIAPALLKTNASFDFVESPQNGGRQWEKSSTNGAGVIGGSPIHQKRRERHQRRFSLQSISLSSGFNVSNYSLASNKAEAGSPTTPDQTSSPNRFRSPANSFGSSTNNGKGKANIDELKELRKCATVGSRRAKFFKRDKTKSHDDFDIPECMVQ